MLLASHYYRFQWCKDYNLEVTVTLGTSLQDQNPFLSNVCGFVHFKAQFQDSMNMNLKETEHRMEVACV